MDRVCVLKSTGDVIEFQSGGYVEGDKGLSDIRLSVLKDNALKNGYKEDQIEVKWITQEQSAVVLGAINTSEDATINSIISDKIRQIAVTALISEGILDKDGKLQSQKG